MNESIVPATFSLIDKNDSAFCNRLVYGIVMTTNGEHEVAFLPEQSSECTEEEQSENLLRAIRAFNTLYREEFHNGKSPRLGTGGWKIHLQGNETRLYRDTETPDGDKYFEKFTLINNPNAMVALKKSLIEIFDSAIANGIMLSK